MSFGPLLKKTRLMAGLTQEEMGFELNLSRPNISKLERDLVELRAADLIKWLQVTKASEVAAALLCGVDVSVVIQNISMLVGAFIMWL